MTIRDISRIYSVDEFDRFDELLQKRNYACIADEYFGIYNAFLDCWANKIQFERLGIAFDNLLDTSANNPLLRSHHDAEIAYQKWKNKMP